MSKFKVGDIVIGNSLANHYGFTGPGTIWRVSRVITSAHIQLETLEKHDDRKWDVEARYFDLYTKGVKKPPAYKPVFPEVFVYKNGKHEDG